MVKRYKRGGPLVITEDWAFLLGRSTLKTSRDSASISVLKTWHSTAGCPGVDTVVVVGGPYLELEDS